MKLKKFYYVLGALLLMFLGGVISLLLFGNMVANSRDNRAIAPFDKVWKMVFGDKNAARKHDDTSSSLATDVNPPLDSKKINLGTTITYTGSGIVVTGSTVTLVAGGDYTVTGALKDGMLYVNTKEKVRLWLNGVEINHSTGPAIHTVSSNPVFVYLIEGTSNTLTDGSSYKDTTGNGTLCSFNSDLIIDGAGSLTINANYKHAINGDENVIIQNGNITIVSVDDGVHTKGNLTVNGGTFKFTTNGDCLDITGDAIINKGNFSFTAVGKGMSADKNLTVNGGTVTVFQSDEALECKEILTIRSGKITLTAKDDGLNADIGISIEGGITNITAEADGIDSNGWFKVNGGYTVVYGGPAPESGVDCAGDFSITGGTLIAMGGDTTTPTARTSSQYAAILGGASAGAKVNIKNISGKQICSFIPQKTYKILLYSSPDLKLNKMYKLFINETLSKTFTINKW
jgi:hypothetical protein